MIDYEIKKTFYLIIMTLISKVTIYLVGLTVYFKIMTFYLIIWIFLSQNSDFIYILTFFVITLTFYLIIIS